MDQDSPAKPREQKVSSQRTRWKILLLFLCLLHGSSMTPPHRQPHSGELQAGSPPSRTPLCTMEAYRASTPPCCWKNSLTGANALRGPRLVSGEPGGAVSIHCHYAPTSVNRHQRKYWCRLAPPSWTCYTVVSTNLYTHRDYRGRVALTDFPQSALFTVKLFRLSRNDTGLYRCGIGDRNDKLFFRMNLIVSPDPFNTTYAAVPASGELVTASSGEGSTAANRWTSGVTQILEGQGSELDRTAPTTANRWTPGVTRNLEGQKSEWVSTAPTTANRRTPGVTQILEGQGSELDRTTPTTANRKIPGVTQILEGQGSELDRTAPTTVNRQTPGVTQTLEGQGSELDRTTPTTVNRKIPGVTQILEGQGSELDRTTPTTANRKIPGVTQILEGQGSELDRTTPTTANRKIPGVTQILESQKSEWVTTAPTTANRRTPGVTQILEGQGSELDRTTPTTANRKIPGVTQILEGQGSELDRTAPTTVNRQTPGVTQTLEGQGSELDRTTPTTVNRKIPGVTQILEGQGSELDRTTPTTANRKIPGVTHILEGQGSELDRTTPTTANRKIPGVTQILESQKSEWVTTAPTTANRRTPGVTQILEGQGSELDRTTPTTANRKIPGVTQILESQKSEWVITAPTTANRRTPEVTQILESQGSELDRTTPTTANRKIPGVTQILEGQGSELDRTAPTTVNRQTPGVTQILESQGSPWDRIAPTTRISKTTVSAHGRSTPRIARTTVPGRSSREKGSTKATVPTPESPASKPGSMFSTTQGAWILGARNSVTTSASTSEGGRTGIVPEAEGPQGETEVSAPPGALGKTTGTTGPSVLISEPVTWETLQEATEDNLSKRRLLYSAEEPSPAPSAWTLNATHMQVASRSVGRSLENAGEESSPPTPSQLSSGGPMWTPGKGSSMKSVFTEGESNSWILTPVSGVLALVLLAALVLLKRRLWRTSQKTERSPRITLIQNTHFLPDKLSNAGKSLQQGDHPPAQANLTALKKDSGP